LATYAIGDIQGCFDNLISLLEEISFDPEKDTLWFAGDLINRGDKSLQTLRYIKSLGERAISVLGNHDLTLLAICEGVKKIKKHTLDDILQAPDRDELIHWLRHRPLLHHDKKLGYTMIHAGLPPQWDLITAQNCAREVENILQGDDYPRFMANMFGDKPDKWNNNLKGWERLRFITNCLTRMRYCKPGGKLDLKDKGPVGSQKEGYIPWYEISGRKSKDLKIIFGHWSTLFGDAGHPNVYAIDTGCLWGGTLTAMKLDGHEPINNPKFYSIECEKPA